MWRITSVINMKTVYTLGGGLLCLLTSSLLQTCTMFYTMKKNELVYMHQDNLRGVQDGKMMRDDTESF